MASNFRAGGEYTRTHGTDDLGGSGDGGRCIGRRARHRVRQRNGRGVGHRLRTRTEGRRHPDVQLPRRAIPALRIPATGSRRTAAGRHHRHGRRLPLPRWAPTSCGSRLRPTRPSMSPTCRRSRAGSHDAGASMVVDSTFATPLLQRPLEHGAAIVLHSGTKFIGGHSDLLIGLCVTTDDDVYERLVQARTFQGATPGALEAFLALRGLRTMPIRLAAMQRNAVVLVERLRAHPSVADVRYPGPGGDGVVRRATAVRRRPTRCAPACASWCRRRAWAASRPRSRGARSTPAMHT